MKLLGKKIIIFIIIFILAIAGYFYFTPNTTKDESMIYTRINEASLPIIQIHTLGRKMNEMHPYTTVPGSNAFYDSLTILPENRKLQIYIPKSQEKFTSIHYEIHSVNLEDLIEKTQVTDYTMEEEGTNVFLPIQNLLTEGREYRLAITLSFPSHPQVYYYTRIWMGGSELASAMLDLATEFSDKNFNYETAKENTIYLETDNTGDNSSLAQVNLKSSFDMLTYNRLGLRVIGEKDIRLSGFDGRIGEIKVNFMAGRELDDGRVENYEITESFTLRQGPERLYMMDYTRKMCEIFESNDENYTGNRIILGIGDGNRISTKSSEDGRHLAFVSNRELFCFDTQDNISKKIFSFRSDEYLGIHSNYAKHGVKILSVEEDGSVEYIVYGYMNRGKHEGSLGIALHRYDKTENAIIEQSFIPVPSSYEEIAEGVQTLSYLGDNNMLYLRIADSVYGIDINSNDYLVIAENIPSGMYGVNQIGNRFVWQSTLDIDGSPMVNFINLDTGEKKEVVAKEGELLRIGGFIDQDLIVVKVRESDIWNVNGKKMQKPAYRVEIIDDLLQVVKEYEKDGQLLSNFEVEEGRIHLDILNQVGADSFRKVMSDTIVTTVELYDEQNQNIGYYALEDKTRIYYVVPGQEFANLGTTTQKFDEIFYGMTGKINIEKVDTSKKYIAIGHGEIVGIYDNAAESIQKAYEHMGSVRKNGELIYLRANTSSARNLKNPSDIAASMLEAREEDKLFALRGISLRQSLYYVSNGMPVLTYSDGGNPLIIYSYNRDEIVIYDTITEETLHLDYASAEAMFELSYNDFSCFFTFS